LFSELLKLVAIKRVASWFLELAKHWFLPVSMFGLDCLPQICLWNYVKPGPSCYTTPHTRPGSSCLL